METKPSIKGQIDWHVNLDGTHQITYRIGRRIIFEETLTDPEEAYRLFNLALESLRDLAERRQDGNLQER